MRVMVATDLSEGADAALREGAALASGVEDALAVIHVVPIVPVSCMTPLHRDASADLIRRAGEAVRERLDGTVGRAAEVMVCVGIDYAEIVERAEEWRADVVVVGAYGRSGLTRVLGGVTERVLRHARCGVLVARPALARGWVLAATDLSEPSLVAVHAAAKQAHRRGARLKVVHAIGFLEVEAAYVIQLATPSISESTRVLDQANRALKDAVRRTGIDAECKIVDKPAAVAIVLEAEAMHTELVVVGSHGRTGLSHLLMGSVAEKVSRYAPCSVLMVGRPNSA